MHITILNWFWWVVFNLYTATGNPAYLQAMQTIPQYDCLVIEWDGDRAITSTTPGVCGQ